MTGPRDRTPVVTSPTATSKPIVILEDISLSYGSSTVLAGVTGRVPAGQALTLMGPSGSGKTTLMWALLGMVIVDRGRVHVNGAAPGRTPRGSVGYTPQFSGLDPTFPVTVRGVVRMGMYSQLDILWRPDTEARRRALEALESVGLADRAERRFGTLSGGQQQRVLVTHYVTARPRLVLLDEPFNGLDQPSREALLSIITSLRDQGISLAVSTHDFALAQKTYGQATLLIGRQIAFSLRDGVLVTRYIDGAHGGRDTTQLLGLRFGTGTQEPS